jgi:hypothetical protein
MPRVMGGYLDQVGNGGVAVLDTQGFRGVATLARVVMKGLLFWPVVYEGVAILALVVCNAKIIHKSVEQVRSIEACGPSSLRTQSSR